MTESGQKDLRDVIHALDRTQDRLEANTETQKRLCKLLEGNGDPQKGLVVRVDRLEQDHHKKKKWTWAALGTALTAAGHAVVSYFQSTGKS